MTRSVDGACQAGSLRQLAGLPFVEGKLVGLAHESGKKI